MRFINCEGKLVSLSESSFVVFSRIADIWGYLLYINYIRIEPRWICIFPSTKSKHNYFPGLVWNCGLINNLLIMKLRLNSTSNVALKNVRTFHVFELKIFENENNNTIVPRILKPCATLRMTENGDFILKLGKIAVQTKKKQYVLAVKVHLVTCESFGHRFGKVPR